MLWWHHSMRKHLISFGSGIGPSIAGSWDGFLDGEHACFEPDVFLYAEAFRSIGD